MRFLMTIPVVMAMAAADAAWAQTATVAVDVGHTLTAPGATSARGRSELAFNHDLAVQVAAALQEKGLGVLPINFDGQIGSLDERPKQAAGADFFLSIHHDSVSTDNLLLWVWEGQQLTYTEAKRGFGLFVSANSPDLPTSLTCASAMGAMLRRAGFMPASEHRFKHVAADAENGVWYYDNLVVLYRTTMPAVLFEAGVIKHRDEELELLDPARQARMADRLATGIAACMQVRRAPKPAAADLPAATTGTPVRE